MCFPFFFLPIPGPTPLHPHQSVLTVLVYNANYDTQIAKARAGESMGELVYWRAVLQGLKELYVSVTVVTNEEDLQPHLQLPIPFDIILTDGYSLEPFVKGNFFVETADRCKFRVLDDWGQ